MSASYARASKLALVIVSLGSALPTFAQADQFKVNLTEAPEPDSRPWEDPARIALTIDPNGPDQFSAQVNLEAGWDLTRTSRGQTLPRSRSLNGYFRWNRETGDDPQNNVEAGLVFKSDYDLAHLLSHPELRRFTREQRADLATRQARNWDWAWRIAAGYSRTAAYPDLDSAVCVATPTLPQCQTQFKESFRVTGAATLFNSHLENNVLRADREGNDQVVFAYSIQPKIGFAFDQFINRPINPDTGIEAHGSYISVVGGIAATITPSFLNPGWELKASAQIRQRLHASSTRRPSIERTAEQFEISATYYFIRPAASEQNGWRAGLGLVYSHGGDPLTGAPDVDRIVLALRLGRF